MQSKSGKVNSRFATIIAVKYADALEHICASSACAEYVFGNWLIKVSSQVLPSQVGKLSFKIKGGLGYGHD